MDPTLSLLDAIAFAAEKHKFQQRKGNHKIPYINHPVQVAKCIARAGEIRHVLLQAALLHDTLEDTDATEDEIETLFGKEVLSVVLEVTDDKSLPFQTRKDKQEEKAPHLSDIAAKIKLADKICNIKDVLHHPPDWDRRRKIEYFDWCNRVVNKLSYKQEELLKIFNETYTRGREELNKS